MWAQGTIGQDRMNLLFLLSLLSIVLIDILGSVGGCK